MPIRVKGNLFCFAFASKKPDFIIIMINNAFGATVMNFSAKKQRPVANLEYLLCNNYNLEQFSECCYVTVTVTLTFPFAY